MARDDFVARGRPLRSEIGRFAAKKGSLRSPRGRLVASLERFTKPPLELECNTRPSMSREGIPLFGLNEFLPLNRMDIGPVHLSLFPILGFHSREEAEIKTETF